MKKTVTLKYELGEIINAETWPDHDHWSGWTVWGIDEATDKIMEYLKQQRIVDNEAT